MYPLAKYAAVTNCKDDTQTRVTLTINMTEFSSN